MASFDVMPDTQLYQPAELDDALRLADQYGKDGWILGGGQDTYGWLKDRAKHPRAMIDLNGVSALKGIRESDDGIEMHWAVNHVAHQLMISRLLPRIREGTRSDGGNTHPIDASAHPRGRRRGGHPHLSREPARAAGLRRWRAFAPWAARRSWPTSFRVTTPRSSAS